ncbi:MAG: hypothetical protein LUP94_00865 [Candidatus Methanomethylicus sp.]|nr:hypothetical protein [Candidatus Methanomethylicus sp.]
MYKQLYDKPPNGSKVIRSFSIDERVIKALQDIAIQRKTSVNAIIGNMLVDFVNFSYMAEDIGLIRMDQAIAKELIRAGEYSDEEIRVAGDNAFKKWNFIKNLNGDYNAFISILKDLFNGPHYCKCKENNDENKTQIWIFHGLGETWNDILIQYVIGGYNGMFGREISEEFFTKNRDGFTLTLPKSLINSPYRKATSLLRV